MLAFGHAKRIGRSFRTDMRSALRYRLLLVGKSAWSNHRCHRPRQLRLRLPGWRSMDKNWHRTHSFNCWYTPPSGRSHHCNHLYDDLTILSLLSRRSNTIFTHLDQLSYQASTSNLNYDMMERADTHFTNFLQTKSHALINFKHFKAGSGQVLY